MAKAPSSSATTPDEWYMVLLANGITEGVEINGFRILKIKPRILKPRIIVKDLSTGGEIVYELWDFLEYIRVEI